MKYWCLNFDPTVGVRALQHGADESLWLMQYQYSDHRQVNQGGDQKSQTSGAWAAVEKIEIGDWCVAYLPPRRFFAIGEVIEPRKRERHLNKPIHQDSIERTIREHRHLYFDGVIYYVESDVLYEDFTDDWNITFPKDGRLETYKYPQRIDVEEWLHAVPSGIRLRGLRDAASNRQRDVVFEIDQDFFDTVRRELVVRSS